MGGVCEEDYWLIECFIMRYFVGGGGVFLGGGFFVRKSGG